jgi:hypothetical protein
MLNMAFDRSFETIADFASNDWEAFINNLQALVDKYSAYPKDKNLQSRFSGKRGVMVVAALSSRQRSAKRVDGQIIPDYLAMAGEQNLGLTFLAANAPKNLGLMKAEPKAMQQVAQILLDFGNSHGLHEDDEICSRWAAVAELGTPEYQEMLDVNGVGPALIQYLRMLCGADTIKIDGQVKKSLKSLGLNVECFTDIGIYHLCVAVSRKLNFQLFDLDQALWFESSKNS